LLWLFGPQRASWSLGNIRVRGLWYFGYSTSWCWVCLSRSLFKLGAKCVKVNHTLSMRHGPAASRNATAKLSIADQYVSDHLYDYLCMSRVVPWRGRRWVFDGSWAGRRKMRRGKDVCGRNDNFDSFRFASRSAP
jgi:hypothetical protein